MPTLFLPELSADWRRAAQRLSAKGQHERAATFLACADAIGRPVVKRDKIKTRLPYKDE